MAMLAPASLSEALAQEDAGIQEDDGSNVCGSPLISAALPRRGDDKKERAGMTRKPTIVMPASERASRKESGDDRRKRSIMPRNRCLFP